MMDSPTNHPSNPPRPTSENPSRPTSENPSHPAPKILIIVQARMSSERLPGKVLLPVLQIPLLSYLLERLKKVTLADQLIVATTIKPIDDPIVTLCSKHKVDTYRGTENDVLDRYYQAAKIYSADIIVRITADCPLIDPFVIDRTILYFLENDFDYVSNTLERTYPRGMDTEVFSFNALERAAQQATNLCDREHVTYFMYTHPNDFKLSGITYHMTDVTNHATENRINPSSYRLTVDTQEDFTLIKMIIETLAPTDPEFTLEHILELLQQHPDWAKINAHIEQKKIQSNVKTNTIPTKKK